MTADWTRTYRLDALTAVPPDADGWIAFDLKLRPLDRRGRVNGRAKYLTTLSIGGPPESVDMTGLEVGRKYVFTYASGPTPTNKAVIRPADQP